MHILVCISSGLPQNNAWIIHHHLTSMFKSKSIYSRKANNDWVFCTKSCMSNNCKFLHDSKDDEKRSVLIKSIVFHVINGDKFGLWTISHCNIATNLFPSKNTAHYNWLVKTWPYMTEFVMLKLDMGVPWPCSHIYGMTEACFILSDCKFWPLVSSLPNKPYMWCVFLPFN